MTTNDNSTTADEAAAPRILFLHLPKTAGTALRELFASMYGEDRVTRSLGALRMDEALVDYADADVICGHLIARPGVQLPSDRITMTILRDPIDRFVSYYNFRKFNVSHGSIDARIHGTGIADYVELLGDGDLRDLNTQTTILYPLGTDDHRHLPWAERVVAAKRALDAFDLVGTHDEIDDFTCMLGARFGWPRGENLGRHNVTDRREGASLPEDTLRTLERLLQPDIEVFRHARDRFRQQRRNAIGAGPRVEARQVVVAASRPDVEFGDRRIEISSVSASGTASGTGVVMVGEQMSIDIDFIAHESLSNVSAGFLIRDERGLPMYGTNTWLLGETCAVTPGPYRATFVLLNRLHAGPYTLDAHLIRNGSHAEGCHHWKERIGRFDVSQRGTPHFEGRVLMDPSWTFTPLDERGRCEVTAARASGAPDVAPTVGRFNAALRSPRARIAVLNTLPATATGTESLMELDVRNAGSERWPCDGKRPVNLSYHWIAHDGSVVTFDGIRTRLPRDIEPGQSIRVTGFVRAPHHACGRMQLVWTLVQEGVAWFDLVDKASAATMDVLVT